MTTPRDSARGFDAIVVGSGFAGSWAAKELTEAGCHTLVLEAGPRRRADEIPRRGDEKHRADVGTTTEKAGSLTPQLDGSHFVRVQDAGGRQWARQHRQRLHPGFISRGPHLFVDDVEQAYQTPEDMQYHWIRGMQVGGRSLIWGGSALRLSRYELDAPPVDGYELAWPIRYEELSEAYAVVEAFMGPRGTAEGLAQLPDSVYQTDGCPLTPAERAFQEEAHERLGTRPVPVRFVPADHARGDWPRHTMQATALAAAERTGLLTLWPDTFVTEVMVDPDSSLATGVRYVDTRRGDRRDVRGRVVFLCCGTIETARLMLNSQGPRHPDGLGNSSGWVGRGLMDHPVVSSIGVLDDYEHAAEYEWTGRQCGLLVPPRPDRPDDVRPFGMWVHLQRLVADGRAMGGIDLQGEMLPRRHNRVRLSGERDQWGVPIPLIECAYGPHEQRLFSVMRRELTRVAVMAGLRIVAVSDALTTPGLNAHDLGTARMGSRPDTSVVDAENQCWDCPNTFVTDGACFPSGGWQNPTLTIMALSARAGRRAARLLRAGVY